MNRFLERLKLGKPLVADGATGTNLHKLGLKSGIHPEDLVFDQPEVIFNLAKSFADAGSDLLLTCTFGGTRLRMKESPHAARVTELNTRAVEITRRAAADGNLLVAGSIGPTGMLLKPYGPLTAEEARSVFKEQVEGLVAGGVDLLVIETMFSLEEADAALHAAREVSDLPVVVSFSYDRGVRTMMGVKPDVMLQHYKEMGAVMIGANCGTSLENMEKIAAEYSAAAPGFPLWIKPNAGLPRMVDETAVYDTTPEQMGAFALKFTALGARVVGGCCGSSPEHVAAIAQAVKQG